MSQPPAEPATTLLERPWITAALLLGGVASYSAVFINTMFFQAPGQAANVLVNGLILGMAAVLTGLMVFAPARPPGLLIRLGVYGVPIGLALLFVPGPTGSVEFLIAFLLPWALITALYGVRGGLPKGWRYVLTYSAAAVASYLLLATIWINELVWLMPVLPFLLLLRSRFRKRWARIGVEILLAIVLAACIGVEFVILPQGESWLAYRNVVGTACSISLFHTLVLLGLARHKAPDTQEYLTRAEQRPAASRLGAGPVART